MRVYIAGRYNADNMMEVLGNIRRGMNATAMLLSEGYHAYCPWLDHELAIGTWGEALTEQILKENAMAWLEVCDAIYVLPGWEKSKGTKAEIERAEELNIPVFFGYVGLNNFRAKQESKL